MQIELFSWAPDEPTRLLRSRWVAKIEASHGKGHYFPSFDFVVERQGAMAGHEKYFPLKFDYYTLTLGWRFLFGMDHTYYDGPHHRISCGFIHFSWAPKHCEKCEKD